MKITFLLASAALVAASEESQHLRQDSRELANNHPVCYEILNSWWEDREALKQKSAALALDASCSTFDDNEEICKSKDARAAMSNGYTPTQLSAACTVVGGHSAKCVGNPCNHFNTGECTLQNTGGLCKWFTKEEFKANKAHWTKMLADAKARGDQEYIDDISPLLLTGYGCQRNPCNLAGLGKDPIQRCNNGYFAVPGLYDCTWCKGAGDRLLKGKGVGCQMTQATTTAACAPVNGVPKGTKIIYPDPTNKNCQCVADYPACNVIVESRSDYTVGYY